MTMKKIFISILSAAMFAACAKTETENITPVNPEPEDEAQTVYVEIGATTGSDTKATYDENLKAYWEAGDQILAIQGSATNKTYNFPSIGSKDFEAETNVLSLNDGEMTNTAKFIGDITVYDSDNNRYFHFAYPAGQSQMKTNTHIPYGQSSVSTDYKTTTTCSYTVPSEQDGKWTPFLCTSTADKTTAANITNIDFGTSRNACFAVRVYESDKTTPKKIKSITIVAENNIVGTISATTDNDGSFAGKEFEIIGGGNMITADNLQNIETLNGLYEYRFEVLPIGSGKISLTVTDESGSVITRTANAKTFKANTRSGVNVYWDAATITMDEPLSWYGDTTANKYSTLKTDVIYVNNVAVHGVSTSDITEVGVYVNGNKYQENNVSLSFNKEIAAYAGSGVYTIKPYAIISGKGEITGEEKSITVTGELSIASHTIRSSYNSNGAVAKNNDLAGDKIYAKVLLNDTFAAENLIESATLYYGDNTLTIDAKGSEFYTESIAYQAYSDCYAKIEFKNGYVISTTDYTINVTGIPYSITTNSATPTGWETSNTTTSNGKLLIKDGGYILSPAFYASSECSYGVNASAQVYCYRGSLTSATYTLSMQTDPSGNANLSENLSGGTNTSSSSTKSIYPDLNTSTKIKIGSTKIKTGGFSAISYGIRVHSFSVEYN